VTRQVGIVGASGYGGAELVRLLAGHPELELAVVAAHSQAGRAVSDLFPNLAGDLVFDDIDPPRLAGLDLVFVATPHGVALDLVADLVARGTRVVDLSAAYRLTPSDFATWYRQDHTHPELAPAVYGLTEWARPQVADAALVANPGCYPTATLLGLLPLKTMIAAGSVVVDAKSGTSGAGRGLRDDLHFSAVHADVAAYAAPTHRHTIEIEHWLDHAPTGPSVGSAPVPGRPALAPVSFTPHLAPMARGLSATVYATLTSGVTPDDVQTALHASYDHEPFVQVLAPGTFPHTKALTGSNGCHLSAVVDERTGRVVVTSAIDNLGKGAAGQALQNANLMLGLDETRGLASIGTYP
jgi:N-acetyl-gamma-glutamyl-phosphate reductase